jgi:hypothetical protein
MKRNTLCGTGFILAQTETYIDICGRYVVCKNASILLVRGTQIGAIRKNKSVGPDRVSGEILKLVGKP